MKSVLVVTSSAPQGIPSQGFMVAERLRQLGVRTTIVGRARSSWGRLVDTVFRGCFLVPRNDVVLIDVFAGRAFVYESIAILYARLRKKRTIAVLHSGFMRDFLDRWPRWTRFVLSQPDLVFVPHHFLQKHLSAARLRIDGIVPNFIQVEKYQFRARSVLAPRFLYLRGMHPFYNAPMALRTFSLIQRKYPDALLTMAGKEDKDSEHCRSLARNLNLRNVQFLGLVPKEQIPVLADKHDIYLQTNRVDNMPVSIIEMWACGLPIVSTAVGGIPYLIRHSIDGILVKSEDIQAAADACLELLSNSDLANTLSHNGRARALELTWDRVKPIWERALSLDGEAGTEIYAREV